MYAVEIIVCSALFYALYRLLLEGRVAHNVARWYLVLSVVLSVSLPLLELPILPAEPLAEVILTPIEISAAEVELLGEPSVELAPSLDWLMLLTVLYLAVVAILVARFVVSLIKIYRLRKRCTIGSYHDCYLAMGENITEPFSFGRTIFVSLGECREQVLLHEYSHISHYHTAERIFFEVVRCLMWFNPFIHLIGRSAVQVQEWQADGDVLSRGFDINQYRQIIFHQLFGYTPDITCGLNNNLTKKRFIMMTQFKRGRYPLLRLCAVIPIVVAIIFAFGSVKAQPEQTTPAPAADSAETTKTIVEIRNGGEEILLNEKSVTLEQLPELAKQIEDEVVTIAADDNVPMGAVSDVKQALRSGGKLKVTYQKGDNAEAVTIAADDASEVKESLRSEGKLKVNYQKDDSAEPAATTTTIKARNLLQVAITANGKILIRGEECSKAKLKREVKRFIHNYHLIAINTHKLQVAQIRDKYGDSYSEFTTTALNMPNGKRLACPVSKGVVSVSSDSNASFAAVNETVEIVKKAFDELRQSLSRRVYGKGYDKLDETYKAEINKAVPYSIAIAS